jgi:hypothetical protein
MSDLSFDYIIIGAGRLEASGRGAPAQLGIEPAERMRSGL